jgi:hypothetical protein
MSANDALVGAAGGIRPLAANDTPVDEYVDQVGVRFALSGVGARVEVELPAGQDMDEKNPLHVLAWYISAHFSDLLPTAINAWHVARGLAARSGGDLVQPAAPRILGADAKPL